MPVAGCDAPSSCVGRVPGVPEIVHVDKPPPFPGLCPEQGLYNCLTVFVCPPTHPPRGVRDLSACLVWSSPAMGGDAGHYRLRALVSATLWAALFPMARLVSGTPSQSYMICPVLVQCVPTPLANITTCYYSYAQRLFLPLCDPRYKKRQNNRITYRTTIVHLS